MDPEELLAELERLAERLKVSVRYEHTGGRVGRCLLRGEIVVLLDRSLPLADRIEGLAATLADLEHDTIYLPELVRDLLEAHR